MAKETIIIQAAKTEQSIQQIEFLLNQLKGIERVLIDTTDGEVNVEYNEKFISKEQITDVLKKNHFQ